MKPTTVLILLTLLPLLSSGQKIDNTASFRNISSESYFRFNYDNDYFTSTDKNYTQGFDFELTLKKFKSNPVNYLLVKPKNSELRYGLLIEHIAYAPDDIKSPEIQFGDRPFAAAVMLKSFIISTDTINRSRFISAFSVGIIGPGAFGKEMQTAIHEGTGNTIPQGWQNQIKNDAALNYEISYEKQLLQFGNFFSLQGGPVAKAGTLFTNASLQMNAMIGIIRSPFTSAASGRAFHLYAYFQPMASFIGYDATLQGGLFNRESPYTIAGGEIERFTAQHNYGIVLQTNRLYFEYSRTAITREFESGAASKWGGIRLGIQF